MEKVKLSPPWDGYAHEIAVLFEKDDSIKVKYDQNVPKITIWVDDTDKYEALSALLPNEKDFGGQKLEIQIVPANIKDDEKDAKYYLKKLFKGNNAVTDIVDVTMGAAPVTYIEFEKEVIQYYNDNLADLHGNKSALMEDIARDVFEDVAGVFFCTDIVDVCPCE
jgi:hypothetical protein